MPQSSPLFYYPGKLTPVPFPFPLHFISVLGFALPAFELDLAISFCTLGPVKLNWCHYPSLAIVELSKAQEPPLFAFHVTAIRSFSWSTIALLDQL